EHKTLSISWSHYRGFSIYMILATAGISGAMGSVALTYFWERLTGVKNAKS
ncbi:hypothetical protein LL331_23270, partial [Escherichia coli]|nr:hypothetical protein [Escherichia coli]